MAGIAGRARSNSVSEEERGDLLGDEADDEDSYRAPGHRLLLFWRANAKLLLLVAVVSQNSCYSLLRQYAGGIKHTRATTSSILMLQELMKLLASAAVMSTDSATIKAAVDHDGGHCSFVFQHSAKMIVPASMYLVMNILGFIALAHISAGLFAVLQQCKLIFTAVLSRLILGRTLSWGKWRSLLLLFAGVVLITVETTSMHAASSAPAVACPPAGAGAQAPAGVAAPPLSANTTAATIARAAESPHRRTAIIGVTAVLVEACLSGFANVYFEGVVKSTPLSIWHRNVQLSTWSLAIFVPMAIYEGEGHVLAGWDVFALGNALMGALGGILVALCIAYFDSIAKSVAVTMSVVLTVGLGKVLLNGPMSAHILIGSLVVIVSTINYSFG